MNRRLSPLVLFVVFLSWLMHPVQGEQIVPQAAYPVYFPITEHNPEPTEVPRPTGSILINSGDDVTPFLRMELALDASSPNGLIESVRFSDRQGEWGAWQTYELYVTFDVREETVRNGDVTIYAEFQDSSGQSSLPVFDTIRYDPLAPWPTETPAPTAQPSPTARPSAVLVLSSTTYSASSSSDYRYIVGEVLNNTNRNVQFVKIVASLFDESGHFIGSEFTYTMLDVLTPGQKAPFKLITTELSQKYAPYQLQVQWSNTNEQPLSNFAIPEIGRRNSSIPGWHYLYGRVRNDTGVRTQFIKIVATMYDSNDRVIDVEFTYSQLDYLNPGELSPFELLSMHWVGVVDYQLQVQASEA